MPTITEEQFSQLHCEIHYLNYALTPLRNRFVELLMNHPCRVHSPTGPTGLFGGPGPVPPDFKTSLSSVQEMRSWVDTMNSLLGGKLPCGCPVDIRLLDVRLGVGSDLIKI